MDPTQAFSEVEFLYRQVLALTLRQESSLRAGEIDELPAIVQEQMEILGRAEGLMLELHGSSPRSDPTFQAGIQRLAAILGEVVASEERCKEFAPDPRAPLQPPSARVLAAYGKR